MIYHYLPGALTSHGKRIADDKRLDLKKFHQGLVICIGDYVIVVISFTLMNDPLGEAYVDARILQTFPTNKFHITSTFTNNPAICRRQYSQKFLSDCIIIE